MSISSPFLPLISWFFFPLLALNSKMPPTLRTNVYYKNKNYSYQNTVKRKENNKLYGKQITRYSSAVSIEQVKYSLSLSIRYRRKESKLLAKQQKKQSSIFLFLYNIYIILYIEFFDHNANANANAVDGWNIHSHSNKRKQNTFFFSS